MYFSISTTKIYHVYNLTTTLFIALPLVRHVRVVGQQIHCLSHVQIHHHVYRTLQERVEMFWIAPKKIKRYMSNIDEIPRKNS